MRAFKKSILALGLVSACIAVPAAAASFSAGPIGADPYVSNVTKASGGFVDTYDFSVVAGDLAAGGLSSDLTVALPTGPLNLFHISGLAFTLFSGSTPLDAFTGNGAWRLDDLAPGAYQFKVSGIADGVSGGNYTFTISALPVPEPGEWMMLTAGLILMAATARRRQG